MRAIRSAVSIGASASHTDSGPCRSMIRMMASLTAAHHPRRRDEKLVSTPRSRSHPHGVARACGRDPMARPRPDGAARSRCRDPIGYHAAMSRDDYERHPARDQPGLYESHYLKANSGDNTEAFWIKHNLLVPPGGGGVAEFWLVWFRRGDAPRVWKREVPVSALTLSSTELALRGDRFRLDRTGCEGQIGD